MGNVRLCDKVPLHTHQGAQKDNGMRRNPNHSLPGYFKPITGAISPSKAHLHKLRGAQGCTMEVGRQIKDSQGASTLSGPLPGLSWQSHQPQCPGGTLTTMNHGEQLSRSPLRLSELLPRSGTQSGLHRKSSSGWHRTSFGMFRGGIKGGTRERCK